MFTIRRATFADAHECARMRVASAVERRGDDPQTVATFEDTCVTFFERILGDPRSFVHAWVAEVDGHIVGGASLALLPTFPRYGARFSGVDGRVRDVYVEPAHRRSGIARALMGEVMAEAAGAGVDRLMLGASSMGRPLYESLGFEARPEEMVYLDSVLRVKHRGPLGRACPT